MTRRSRDFIFCFSGLAILQLGCASNVVERDVYDQGGITTQLRYPVEDDAPVDRGFQHPALIGEERLARILAAIEVRIDKNFQAEKLIPAVSPQIVKRVARALDVSLAQANSSEEVALIALRKTRYLGVFSERLLTSFVAYVQNDRLTIALSRVDWNLQRLRTSANNREHLPQPRLGEKAMDFEIVTNADVQAAGAQAVAVRWQDPRWDVEAAAVRPTSRTHTGESSQRGAQRHDIPDEPVESRQRAADTQH